MEQFTRRAFLATAGTAAVSGCIKDEGSEADDPAMDVSSLAFEDGAEIPTEYTCDGANSSPPLRISGIPDRTETLAVTVDDPDAPGDTFVHWLLWNLPAETEQIPQSVPRGPSVSDLGDAVQGTNDRDEVGYSGPCPPESDGPHTYRFFLYALDEDLDLEAGATMDRFEAAIDGRVVAETSLEGTYES